MDNYKVKYSTQAINDLRGIHAYIEYDLSSDSLVWKSGMTQWKKAGEVDGLQSLFSAMPPIPSARK